MVLEVQDIQIQNFYIWNITDELIDSLWTYSEPVNIMRLS